MPELTSILEAKREQDYNHRKFLAAIQGVDLDKGSSGNNDELQRVINRAKQRVNENSGNPDTTTDPNDITTLKGKAAANAGFGIGMGLDYEVM